MCVKYIILHFCDNESYFNNGYTAGTTDGQAKKTDNVSVQYQYHQHTDSCIFQCSEESSVRYGTNGRDMATYAGLKTQYVTCPTCKSSKACSVVVAYHVDYICGASENFGVNFTCSACNTNFHSDTRKHNFRNHKYNICGKNENSIESITINYQ